MRLHQIDFHVLQINIHGKNFPYLTSHTEINSRRITYRHVKDKTTKLLEENIGEYLLDLGISLGRTLKD